MSKNNKEKSSFWKKLGLGKHKASNVSLRSEAAFHEEKQDTNSLKSQRRFSNNSYYSQHKRQHSNTVDKPPPVPHGNIPKQSNTEQHVNHNEPVDDGLPKNNNDTLTPTESNIKNDQATKLQEEIDQLKETLEKEKVIIDTLRKQKEAITKDLDYLGSTVDELYAEKSDLLQQLEDERAKNQRQLEDLNVLMDKMKANADNARDQSFAVDQYKAEFENHLNECQIEKKELMNDISSKDKEIRRLNFELNTTKDQLESLKLTMDQLIQSHAAELSRVTASAAAAAAAAAAESKHVQNASYHTPNGSPQFQPKQEEDLCCSPIPSNSSLPIPSASTSSTPQPIDSDYRVKKDQEKEIDNQLMKLTKEKEKLQSSYSKIPLSGGGPQSRRRKEELEAMLDQVDSQLSKVKQRIRRS